MAAPLLCASAALAAQVSFVTLGDWGGMGLGGAHAHAEEVVASAFQKEAERLASKFVVNVGDNFYYCGVKSLQDPQFKEDFEDIFTADSVKTTWYSALGNHDYGYSVEAQLQYRSPANNRWYLPSRYYAERIALAEGQYMSLIVLDSNPCVKKYRSDNPSGWDPCSGQYGDCPGCRFHDNIIAQNCTAQVEWFKQQLAAVPKGDWLVVVGHHLAHEMDVEDFVTPMINAGVHLYLNGHSHELNAYTVDDGLNAITSGAGCMVYVPKDAPVHAEAGVQSASESGHTHTYRWSKKLAGFTTHTFSEDFSTLTNNFVSYNGSVVYSWVVSK